MTMERFPDSLHTLEAELDVAWERRYGRTTHHPRRRWILTRAALAAAALVVVAAALLGRSGGPGAVDRARAAAGTVPADAIVHFTSVSRDPAGALAGRTELWGASSPPYARRSILQGAEGPAIEQGARGNEVTQYDPQGVVYVRTIAGGTAEGTRPADFAARAEAVRRYLRQGDAQDQGEVTIDGRTLQRFVLTPDGGGECVYDVEPSSFYAVSLFCTGMRAGSTSEHWEYLPRRGNEDLLSVAAQHPSARIDRAPMGECGAEPHTQSTPPCVARAPGA
jgi:hypothetical protein